MPAPGEPPNELKIIDQRRRDDALVDELTAAPGISDARESYHYWSRRLNELPRHKRAERKEATEMATRWKQRLTDAERQQYGPGLAEQLGELLTTLGIRWRPNPRRAIAALGLTLVLIVLLAIALLVAIIVFWPHIQPIVQTLTGNSHGDSGG